MQSLLILALFILVALTDYSCKKGNTNDNCFSGSRHVKFSLFTSKDFSSNDQVITFAFVIRKSNKVVWDSLLLPMKLRDIPRADQKLVVEKIVPGTDPSLLEVGFIYAIENVGVSWYLSSLEKRSDFKEVNFDFR